MKKKVEMLIYQEAQEFGKYHYFGNATIIKVKVANNLVVIQVHVKHVMDMCGSLKSIR